MQPQNPNNQYDFIMNTDQKRKSPLLSGFGLPKPAAIALAVLFGLILLTVIYIVISGNKNKGIHPPASLGARAQEIARVSDLAVQDSKDPNTKALASTVSTILNSQIAGFNSYWSANHHKISTQLLASDQNKATDAQFQTAIQNNNLSTVYQSYLRANLNSYAQDLSTEYKSVSSNQLKTLLNSDYSSVSTILSSPGLH